MPEINVLVRALKYCQIAGGLSQEDSLGYGYVSPIQHIHNTGSFAYCDDSDYSTPIADLAMASAASLKSVK
ncbi:hypothetical protein ASPCADRAFT_9744 [Aspergillus carbonarius ITEM 5010]|uniref:Uncharacterized protein n=1 Tax=Aspergillus carbonarius (strain ITEM 5010) TaxID=602072 RepID=A0A1R3RA41_ASPC5|nr:hypothetical protein ASPCADRAFT_9744 [Aspergillus carbonarius ITEM 5010]